MRALDRDARVAFPPRAAMTPAVSHPLRRTSAAALAASLVATAAGFVGLSVATGEPATACGWCSSNTFDELVRALLVAHDPMRPARWSHALSLGVAPALSFGALTVGALRARRPWHAVQNVAVVVNAFLAVTALADGVKKLADRERPGFHHGRQALTEAATVPLERFLSFFSGDTAWGFAFAAATLSLSTLRGYDRARPVAVAGFSVALGVALLRIAADMHWATNVAMGALVGTAVGLGLPRWLHPRAV